jgi:hypothetical protein
MNKQYKLYEVRDINGIQMTDYVTQTWAKNIVEAEYLLEKDMKPGLEYQITFCGK